MMQPLGSPLPTSGSSKKSRYEAEEKGHCRPRRVSPYGLGSRVGAKADIYPGSTSRLSCMAPALQICHLGSLGRLGVVEWQFHPAGRREAPSWRRCSIPTRDLSTTTFPSDLNFERMLAVNDRLLAMRSTQIGERWDEA